MCMFIINCVFVDVTQLNIQENIFTSAYMIMQIFTWVFTPNMNVKKDTPSVVSYIKVGPSDIEENQDVYYL